MGAIEVKLPDVNLSPEAVGFLQRVLGPFAEAGDFLSEKIRFYRWHSSLKTVKRAEEIAREHGVSPKEVPLKTLVPLLEKASLEDDGSELIEKWATLLAQASADPDLVHSIYVDVLSRLRPEDVVVLELIISEKLVEAYNEESAVKNKTTLWTIRAAADQDSVYDHVRRQILSIMRNKTKEQCYKELRVYIHKLNKQSSTFVENAGVNFDPFTKDDICVFNSELTSFASLDVLESCGLIARRHYRFAVPHGEGYLTLVTPTPFGIGFVSACRGDMLKAPNS
jgi:hypothetical protein